MSGPPAGGSALLWAALSLWQTAAAAPGPAPLPGDPLPPPATATATANHASGFRSEGEASGERLGSDFPAASTLLVPVPAPDLSLAEPSVRESLEAAYALMLDASRDPDRSDRDRAEAHGALGAAYLAHRIDDAAAASFVNAERLAPADPRWPYYRGYRDQLAGLPAAAEAHFRRVLELEPDNGPARLRLARVLLDQDRGAPAAALLAEVAERPELRAAARFEQARMALAARDYAAAATYLEEVLQLAPEATRARYPLAMAYRGLGRATEARAALALAGEGEPPLADPLVAELSQFLQGPRTLFYRGIEALRHQHFEVALASFSRGLEMEPENHHARVTLARAQFLGGDPDSARTNLERVLEGAPGHGLARFLLAVLDETAGATSTAEAGYRQVLQNTPDHGGAHYQLANLLMRRGLHEQASRHYGAAVAAEPKNMPARLLEALALFRAGAEPGRAMTRLEVALSDFPDDPVLRLALARLLAAGPAEVRDGPRALALAGALFDDLGSLEHAEALAMARATTGDFEGAAALAENALRAVTAAGRFDLIPRVETQLARYRSGQPADSPWPTDDPLFHPPPLNARGIFLEYPTKTAY